VCSCGDGVGADAAAVCRSAEMLVLSVTELSGTAEPLSLQSRSTAHINTNSSSSQQIHSNDIDYMFVDPSQSAIAFNPLMGTLKPQSNGHSAAIWSLVHRLLVCRLKHLVQQGGAGTSCCPAQSSPRCTKFNSPPINGRLHIIRCGTIITFAH